MKYKNWIGAIWAVMIALIISGCNPFESHADGSVVSIQISPDTITTHGTSLLSLAKGNTQKFVAAIVSSDSNNVDITELANWYSSDNSVVTVSSDGTVTVFFKIVVIICLFIKLLLFLDLSKPLQRVYSS